MSIKVTNLTDVKTPTLEQYGFVGATIAVGDKTVGPGESTEVDEAYANIVLEGVQHLVSVGALAVGDLPAHYRLHKAQKETAPDIAPVRETRKKEK